VGSWKEQAKRLGFGQAQKIQCCSTDKSTYIQNEPHGIRIGPCFRCGYTDYEPHKHLPTAYQLRMRQMPLEDTRFNRPVTVPMTCAPKEAWVWCLKAGVTPEEASNTYGFGWSDKYRRVIIPILQDMVDTGHFIARSVDPRNKPKYVVSSKFSEYWYAGTGVTVVVEDILSAIAVTKAGYRSMAIGGTSVDFRGINVMTADSDRVVLWFDNDRAGHSAYRKVRKQLQLYPVTVHRVQSEHDPKLYSSKEIKTFLNDTLGNDND